MKIEKEINQTKPFKNAHTKVGVNLAFTSSWLSKKQANFLKPFDISIQQFNILRILRGMQPEAATIKILTERMIDKMSNASRLVEKLKKKGFVERKECEFDRRQVDIVITKKGLDIVAQASTALESGLIDSMKLTDEEANQLSNLLDKLRG
ncbi:MAG: MarR family transcriptional regulator [Aureispira sp.]|nr:MarR family transcriptional regulator [Aureispira sp.]